MSPFRLLGIDPRPFQSLFALDDRELAGHGAMRVIADADSGYPCRVSLEDARVGEELLLLPYVHQPEATPYRASGPIFVRRGACRPTLAAGLVPAYVSTRLISLRAYDAAHMMVDAEVREGGEVSAWLDTAFQRERVAYVQLHNARRGCFSCTAVRA
jgi:hypothetical protein